MGNIYNHSSFSLETLSLQKSKPSPSPKNPKSKSKTKDEKEGKADRIRWEMIDPSSLPLRAHLTLHLTNQGKKPGTMMKKPEFLMACKVD